ncbi:MAG: hypothetical protein JXR50_11755 [Prolixibacteraceae bacterium]|nr:hypothetical protein [Prolixibacteraceae bacterium]MBN2650405.1 hypothetical protein [Prolixibacteraceae bacterium]
MFIILLAFGACDESGSTTFKVDYTEFEKAGSDSLDVYVTDIAGNLCINGHLKVVDGRVELLMINPQVDTVWVELFEAGTDIDINKRFEKQSGNWKFKFSLLDIEDESPYGNYEFEITYDN